MASIKDLVVQVKLVPAPCPHSLCQEWIRRPAWWSWGALYAGVGMFAMAAWFPGVDPGSLVWGGLIVGGMVGFTDVFASFVISVFRSNAR